MKALIIGGAASGKSAYAEQLAAALPGRHYYLATMLPYGADAETRIARHQALRAGKGFETLECPLDLGGLALPRDGVALLECLGNLAANERFEPGGAGEAAGETVLAAVLQLAEEVRDLIVVSNDIFADGPADTAETQAYLQDLAFLNRALAQRFELVVEVVCGIALVHKGVAP